MLRSHLATPHPLISAPARRAPALGWLFAVALSWGAPLVAQQKPLLEPADYARWETLGSALLSADGRRVAWVVQRGDGDTELRWTDAAGGPIRSAPNGSNPAFSFDGRWLAYSLDVPRAERERRERAGEIVRSRAQLVELGTGTTTDLGEIAGFTFSPDATHIALQGFMSEGGADLIVRHLASGGETRFTRTTAREWRSSGAVLAFIISHGSNQGNTLNLFDAHSGAVRPLISDTATLSGLTWREDHDDIVVLRRRDDVAHDEPTFAIHLWRRVSARAARQHVLDPTADVRFPGDRRIVDFRPVRWSDDGRTLFFGVRDRTARDSVPRAANGTEQPNVQVWHSADASIVPEQRIRANLAASASDIAAWHIDDDRVVVLGGPDLESVALSSGRYALGLDAKRYERERMFGPQLRDLYVIDTSTGERRLAAERVQYHYGISPGGRYLLYVRDGHFRTHDTRTGADRAITTDVPTSFINTGHDYGLQEKPPYGHAGWLPDDRGVLLHDRYDVWLAASDGSAARRLTGGAPDRIRHRRIWLNPEDRVVDLSRPTYVALYGERTKRTGFARLHPSRTAERLIYADAQLSRLTRARDADVFVYRAERFDDSPDLFVGSARLSDARQVSNTNAFQADHAWGRSELIEFTTARGDTLQGALFYPADYTPGRRYPLIVDIYETVSNTLHTYSVPSEHSMHNTAVFTQQGYFVFRPDIVYRLRDPGTSAVEALVPAVRRVLATGMIDSAAVGLIGHSWGAYQTAFVITQTDLFAAAVAAAPIANMVSMYLSVFWNTGDPDARIFEIDQGRMEVPFWEDMDAYIRNSPIFHIERMNTPLLVAFGDRDGAVDWHQGIELYNAARRAGKPMVMLVYEGENHSLARRPNQIDYHRRTNEWLAHYLKGEPAAEWMRREE